MAVATRSLRGKRPTAEPRGFYGEAWIRLKAHRAAVISMVVIIFLLIVALFANLIAPYDTSEQFLSEAIFCGSALLTICHRTPHNVVYGRVPRI